MTATERTLPYALLGLTLATGLVDAVSFLALGHVFTANMTGNVVILGVAATGLPGVSVARSSAALGAFMVGAAIGGRLVGKPSPAEQLRAAGFVFAYEIVLVAGAAVAALHDRDALYPIIVLTALAMGIRTAAVRKLGVLDLTTTVLTLTIAGLAADSSLAGGTNPRWQRRIASVVSMAGGAALGAVLLRQSVAAPLAAAVAVAVASSVVLAVAGRR